MYDLIYSLCNLSRSMFSAVKYKFALMAGDMEVVTRLMEEGLTPLIDSEVTRLDFGTNITPKCSTNYIFTDFYLSYKLCGFNTVRVQVYSYSVSPDKSMEFSQSWFCRKMNMCFSQNLRGRTKFALTDRIYMDAPWNLHGRTKFAWTHHWTRVSTLTAYTDN